MRGGAPLEPDVRRTLEDFFDADFGAVRLHRGRLSRWLCRLLRAKAVTVGRRVHFSRAGWALIRRRGERALRLMAHELAHVQQYRRQGLLPMLAGYLGYYFLARLLGRSRGVAYRANPYEREAFAVEGSFRDWLTSYRGSAP